MIKALKAYWYIPVFVIAVFLGWVIFRRKYNPISKIKTELKAIEIEQQVKALEASHSTDQARYMVERAYAKEIEALNKKQADQAREYTGDPAKLAKFLARVCQK